MPKINVRDLDLVDDDYMIYEKIRKSPKKPEKSDEKLKSEQKKSKVTDN